MVTKSLGSTISLSFPHSHAAKTGAWSDPLLNLRRREIRSVRKDPMRDKVSCICFAAGETDFPAKTGAWSDPLLNLHRESEFESESESGVRVRVRVRAGVRMRVRVRVRVSVRVSVRVRVRMRVRVRVRVRVMSCCRARLSGSAAIPRSSAQANTGPWSDPPCRLAVT